MSDLTHTHTTWTAARPQIPTISARIGRAFRTLGSWISISRQRNDLRSLDDRTLQDIGISRADVEREASRRFWDVDV